MTDEEFSVWQDEICPHCNDYPCHCLMDDDLSEPLPEGWDEFAC
jgi:hypothetical protein